MKPRILAVDDEESIREFLEIMLKKEGYEVKCSYTQRTHKTIPGSSVPFEIVLDFIILI